MVLKKLDTCMENIIKFALYLTLKTKVYSQKKGELNVKMKSYK